MDIEQPISPPVPVVMPQSPSRNELSLKRKADFETSAPQSPPSNIAEWNEPRTDGPKVSVNIYLLMNYFPRK